MCRIGVIPTILDKKTILDILNCLEKDGGGDGNGISFFKDGINQVVKGLDLSNNEIVALIETADPGLVVYHTRKASAGYKIDENCQPFSVTNGAICHNGTWKDFVQHMLYFLYNNQVSIQDYLSWSDSRFMALLVKKYGEQAFFINNDDVWVHYYLEDKITVADVYVFDGSFQIANIENEFVGATKQDKMYDQIYKVSEKSVIRIRPDSFSVVRGCVTKALSVSLLKTNFQGCWQGNYAGSYRGI